MLKYNSIIVFTLFFFPSLIWGFDANSSFKNGNSLYEKELYNDAKLEYLNCVKNNYFSKELYLNLGNTYFKLDSIPQSILYYEKGLKLAPDDKNLQYNLNHVNNIINVQPNKNKGVHLNDIIYGYLNKNADFWEYASIISISLSCLLLLIYIVFNNMKYKKVSFYSALGFLLITITLIYFASISKTKMNPSNFAIVFSPYVELKTKPSLNSPTAFELRDGNKVKIVDENEYWYEISHGEGEIGWIEKTHLKRI